MLFVDASALVKRYVRERHSVKVRRLLAAAPIAVSRLSEVQVPSALARLVRERRVPARSRDRAITAFVIDVAAWHVVEITADVTALARTLLHRHDLRAGDAIQLASAVWLRQTVSLSGVLPLIVISRRSRSGRRSGWVGESQPDAGRDHACLAIWMRLPQVSSNTAVVTVPMSTGG